MYSVWITYNYHILTGVSLDFVDEYLYTDELIQCFSVPGTSYDSLSYVLTLQ